MTTAKLNDILSVEGLVIHESLNDNYENGYFILLWNNGKKTWILFQGDLGKKARKEKGKWVNQWVTFTGELRADYKGSEYINVEVYHGLGELKYPESFRGLPFYVTLHPNHVKEKK